MIHALLVVTLAGAPGFSVREINLTVSHEADGKKYPNPVKESYQLTSDGVLHYGAYFGNMPMEMNHNDSVEWKSGDRGRKLIRAAARLADDPTSGFVALPDGKEAPDGGEGYYFIEVTRDDADSTFYLEDPKAKGWGEIDGAYRALIKQMEKETGRPKKPSQLPQK